MNTRWPIFFAAADPSLCPLYGRRLTRETVNMYAISQELFEQKQMLLRLPPIIMAYFATHFFVELIVERGLAPENFLLECLVFLALWLALDSLTSRIFRNQTLVQILLQRQYLLRQVISFTVSIATAALFFKWHSFPLELLGFLILWGVLDWVLNSLSGIQNRT
jgi:hypothetical protein